MTNPDTVIYNTLERAISTDFNRSGQLAGKAVMDLSADIQSGIVAATAPATTVRKGLELSIGVGLQVILGPGEIQKYDGTVIDPDASKYLIGRLDEESVEAIGVGDPTNPRVDAICVEITQTDSDASIRNELQLPDRTISAVSVDKSSRPTLSVTVVAGTPAANPVLPTPTAGTTAVWYVYVPANADGTTIPLLTQYLLDARTRYNPAATSQYHQRDFGMYVGTDESDGVFVGSGRATIAGSVAAIMSNLYYTATQLFPSGSGSLAPSTRYYVYGITACEDTPVSAGGNLGFVPVLTNTAPATTGYPSATIQYRPGFGLFSSSFDTLLVTTSKALYLGTLLTDSTGVFQVGGDGIPLNRDGTSSIAVSESLTNGVSGFPGSFAGWLKEPQMQWQSVTTVRLQRCSPIVAGVPGYINQLDAVMPTNLVSGVTETSSTWYYVYVRSASAPAANGICRSYVSRITNVPPNVDGTLASPETGFSASDYVFAGSFYNNSSSDIERFIRIGNRVWFTQYDVTLTGGDVAADPSFTTATAIVPLSAKSAIIAWYLTWTIGGAAENIGFFIYPLATISNPKFYFVQAGVDAPSFRASVQCEIEVNTSGQYRLNRSALGASNTFTMSSVIQQGYCEDLTSPLNTAV